jgi:peptide/nickel transport system permease protein
MLGYIARRAAMGVVTIIAVSFVSFAIIQLPPGDFISYYVAEQMSSGSIVSEDAANALREQYGLNQPLAVQYVKWMDNVLHGDFGASMMLKRPVRDAIGERLALTVVLSLAGVMFTWVLALPIGIYSAVRQYSVGDFAFTFIGFIGLAIPSFLLALIVMYFAYAWFGVDVGGLFSPQYADAPWSWARVWDLLKHLPLPAFLLGLGGTAQVVRIMRANLLDELKKPYVTTARAKGIAEWKVIWRHPVRVALNPFVSTVGYLFPYVVSGSIIISLVLSLPTVGPLLLQSLVAQDMFLAGAIILMLGVMTVIGTLVSDLLLAWIDPRVQLMEG